jgi:hypothetical protein
MFFEVMKALLFLVIKDKLILISFSWVYNVDAKIWSSCKKITYCRIWTQANKFKGLKGSVKFVL